MKTFLIILGTGVLMLFSAIITGYTLVILWDWFVIPYFKLPELNMTLAIGLSLTARYIIMPYSETPEDKSAGYLILLGFTKNIMLSGFALLAGWVVTLFM